MQARHLIAATLVAVPALALTHDDDPKALPAAPAVTGPGWLPDASTGTSVQNSGPFATSGIQLLGWMSLADLNVSSGMRANDIWGYVSPSGREYAIMGTEESTLFVEVTNPTAPVLIETIPGTTGGTWRDVKTYGEYAYSVCETSCNGIQVINLTQIDQGTVSLTTVTSTQGGGSSHNVAINEDSGYLYTCGGDGNGLRFYNLSNPAAPTYEGTWSDRYVHDAQIVTYTSGPMAGRELAYCCSGFNGGWVSPGLTILDVTNKSNIQVLDQVTYPNAQYSHQGWLTEDKAYFLLGDELDEYQLTNFPSTIHVIDVSDPNNASVAGAFDNGNAAVTHNGYVKGDFLYQANYASGLRVFDVSDPVNGTEVAWIDTHPENDDNDFDGMWSCYPYLPSGIVICSDRQRGLFIVWHGEDRIGDVYCAPSALNSTGLPGRIVATGSNTVGDNDVTLTASSLPANQFGYFLASPSQGMIVGPGGSQGTLCLGSPIARFNNAVQSSGPEGQIDYDVDLTMIPTNPSVAVMAGETWNFQGWYRDVNPAATSNFTDATEVLFN